jgi:CHAT domain-containing protein
VLRGQEATEERLLSLSPSHRILHFATHGTLAANPRDSSLLLASGKLTVERIANLDGLRDKVALVFLSACGSASEIAGGPHEAISLAEGFALAGVPTLIGSLWDVDDRATRVLVESFYRNLVDRRLDTLGALRAAQLATLRTSEGGRLPYADPRFWGAFQLIGDFR